MWLIKNPALYYPLDNQDARRRDSDPKETVKPTVCLWKAEIKRHPKGLVIKDHPMFKGVCVMIVSCLQIIDPVYQNFIVPVRGITSFALSYTCMCRPALSYTH